MTVLGRLVCATVASVVVGVCAASAIAEPRMDGFFDEWSAPDQIATDAAGDASGAFDVQRLYATSRGSKLFLRFDTTQVRNLQSGSAGDGTLRVEIAMPANRFLTIDMRNKRLWRDNNSNLTLSWSTMGYATAPSYAASEFELVVDLAYFGVGPGSAITINFSGADTLLASAPFVMTDPAVVPQRRSADRAPGTAFRVATLNTLQSGIIDGTQAPRLSRLVDAVGADIYCFQEEYDSSAAQIDTFVTGADPLENGASWTVHKNFDNAIATHATLLPITAANSSYAAAVVDFGAGDAVVVFAIHPKCCGYIGSSEDATRISQMNALAGTLANLRSGALGPSFAQYVDAPAIIIGDWNIVGSRTQLDIVENPLGPDVAEIVPENLIGNEVITWRGTSTGAGSFSPGRLDLLTHSNEGLTPLKSFVLDSALLNGGELAALGLQAADSTASDHLMLAADFSFAAPPPPHCDGDADGNLLVDFDDITSVLANWGGPGPEGDADASGLVDFDDITAALANWASNCP